MMSIEKDKKIKSVTHCPKPRFLNDCLSFFMLKKLFFFGSLDQLSHTQKLWKLSFTPIFKQVDQNLFEVMSQVLSSKSKKLVLIKWDSLVTGETKDSYM